MHDDDTRPFLLNALEREVESRLLEAQIFDIDSYGWLNENDPDPDWIGFAMWQTDQPQIDYTALFGESPVSRRPLDVERLILTLGKDLCGLMRASRLSLGLAIIWAPHARRNVLDEARYFWLHHMNAFLSLATASERLRDLLIVACTGEEPKVFEDKAGKKKNRKYVTPFNIAGQLLLSRGLNAQQIERALADLPTEAQAIFVNVDRRNSLVHEIATRIAKQVRQSVEDLQRRYDDERKNGFQPRTGDWYLPLDAAADEPSAEFAAAVKELRDWYSLLIKTTNDVFQVEYWSRTLGRR